MCKCLYLPRILVQYCERVCGLMDKAPDFGSGDCRFESCHTRDNSRLRGATVARLTPDQKVACSNHVGVNSHFDVTCHVRKLLLSISQNKLVHIEIMRCII